MISIASANGLEATKLAFARMQNGVDPLDAVVAGVSLVEDDPNDTSVGYGGIPNEMGEVELDAAVMHGPTHRVGAVAAMKNIRYASAVAKLVMQHSDHVLLAGDGALQFAKAFGFEEENLLTEQARKIWLYWKQTLSPRGDWLPPAIEDVDPEVAKFFRLEHLRTPEEQALAATEQPWSRPTGTIHCSAMNSDGDISCTTSTSGLAFKLPGRVGDSPIPGAGLFCDNAVGSCGSTGRGEANLIHASSAAAVELMRAGHSPKEAGLELLRRIADRSEDRLRDESGRPNFGLKLYLLAKNGDHAGVSLWGPATYAVTDANGTRLEPCVALYDREEKASS